MLAELEQFTFPTTTPSRAGAGSLDGYRAHLPTPSPSPPIDPLTVIGTTDTNTYEHGNALTAETFLATIVALAEQYPPPSQLGVTASQMLPPTPAPTPTSTPSPAPAPAQASPSFPFPGAFPANDAALANDTYTHGMLPVDVPPSFDFNFNSNLGFNNFGLGPDLSAPAPAPMFIPPTPAFMPCASSSTLGPVRRRSRASFAERQAMWSALAPAPPSASAPEAMVPVAPVAPCSGKRKRSSLSDFLRRGSAGSTVCRTVAPCAVYPFPCGSAPASAPTPIPTPSFADTVVPTAKLIPYASPPPPAPAAVPSTEVKAHLPLRPSARPRSRLNPHPTSFDITTTVDISAALEPKAPPPDMLLPFLYHRDEASTVRCGWPECTAEVRTTRVGLRKHIAQAHGLNLGSHEQSVRVQCHWEGCSKTIQWSSFMRHLMTHAGSMSASCCLCGSGISRADMAARHTKLCWSKLKPEVRVKKLEELGLYRAEQPASSKRAKLE